MMLSDDCCKLDPCPNHIAVIGGGRWARVLTEVLCGLVPQFVEISVHSPRNAEGMSAWAAKRGLQQRLAVSADWPQINSSVSTAVVVANAATDHEKAIEWALTAGVPVLVEKPIALTAAAAQRLAKLAHFQNTYFAAAHVFLFARYIEKFSELVAGQSDIQSLRVNWMDPQIESRYGETKSYDPGLPVFADWLPHILAIVGGLKSCQAPRCEKVAFQRGGAHLKIDLMLNDIPCRVELERNGSCRQRVFEVITRQKKLRLDFSSEPGIITSDSTTICGDLDWDVKEKPVARMLRAFLQGVAGKGLDERLDVEIGLRSCQTIDQTLLSYRLALLPWLTEKLSLLSGEIDNDLFYALSEIIYAEEPSSSRAVEKQIEYVCRHFPGDSKLLPEESLAGNNSVEIVKLLLKQGNRISYNYTSPVRDDKFQNNNTGK